MFCSRKRRLWPAVAVAALLLAGGAACRREGRPGVTRLAVASIENLTGDASLDWIGGAAQGVIAAQLAPVPGLRAFPVHAVRDAQMARATQILQGSLTSERGRLRMVCVIEDLASLRMERTVTAEGPAGEGVLPLLDTVSRSLSPAARPFPSRSVEAVRLLTAASDPAGYERAAAADPGFALAYVGQVRWLAARGQRTEALKALESAEARKDRFPPIERAELAILAATLTGDNEARRKALAELAALTPSDSQPLRSLGQLEYSARRFEQAQAWYRRALDLEPDSPELWNMLGYAQAYAGDFSGARKSLAECARVAPDDPNAQDSLGEIGFMAGDFAAAEAGFLAAHSINAAWHGGAALLKAAWSRAMTGDLAGADAILSKYLELRKSFQDPLIPYREAQWEFATGRRKMAMERLARFREAAPGDVGVHAALQLAVWMRQTGDRAGARKLAAEAARAASQPATRRLAAILLFITDSPAPAGEWAVRAERAFPPPAETAAGRYALAYALLLDSHYREAATLLSQMLRQTPPALAGDLNTLTAWALIESGRIEEARSLASVFPPPEDRGEPAFGSLAMPRVLLVHARLASPREAARLMAAYDKLKGDLPDAPGAGSGGN